MAGSGWAGLGEWASAPGSPAELAARAFRAAAAQGATYLQARRYRLPAGPLSAERHWEAGGLVARHGPDRWEGTAAFLHVCFERNPLVRPVAERRTRFRFSDHAPRNRAWGSYWEALSEAGIGEGFASLAVGPAGEAALVHLGSGEARPSVETAAWLHAVAQLLAERLLAEAEAPASLPADRGERLTLRERDVLAWVAEGKTDWEIGVILGIAERGVRAHVERARARLGCATRAQLVARALVSGLL